jgi:tetratricopeptide (TPR) repeat protein
MTQKGTLLGLTIVLTAGALRADPPPWEHQFQRGNAAQIEGRHRAAESLYRSALALYHESDTTDGRIAILLNNLGAECQILGKFDQAESLYKQAIAEWRRFPAMPNPIGKTTTNLAGLYRATARYGQAEAAYIEALDFQDRRPLPISRKRGQSSAAS